MKDKIIKHLIKKIKKIILNFLNEIRKNIYHFIASCKIQKIKIQ